MPVHDDLQMSVHYLFIYLLYIYLLYIKGASPKNKV